MLFRSPGTLKLAYGTHTLWVTQSNGGLESASSSSVTVLVRPAAPVLSEPVDNSETTGPEVEFAGTGVPGSTVRVSNGTTSTTATVDGSGSFRGTLTIVYGTHTLWATQSNGGLESTSSNSVRVLVHPAAPILSQPVDKSETTGPAVEFSGTGIPGFTVTVSNGTSSATATVDSSGGFQGTLTLAYGTHTLWATQSNGVLTSTSSNSVTVLVRPAAPVLSVLENDTATADVTFSGTGIPGSTVTVSSGPYQSKPVRVSNTGKFDGFISFNGSDYGVHTLSATQTTSDGHTSGPSNDVTVLLRPPSPLFRVSAVTNTEVTLAGAVLPGWTVTITDATGSVSATPPVDATGNFSVKLPPAYGTYPLSATQSNGIHTSLPTKLVVPAPVPVITAPYNKMSYTVPNSTTQVQVPVQGEGIPGANLNVFNNGSPLNLTTPITVDNAGRIVGNISLASGSYKLTFSQVIKTMSGSVTTDLKKLSTITVTITTKNNGK